MDNMEVRTETIAAVWVACVRHVGPAFEQLFGRANVVGAAVGPILTLSYDNPEAVPPE